VPSSSRYYLVKSKPIQGQHYSRVKKEALKQLQLIEKQTKRRPYIKSRYFSNQKIFTNLFLHHLFDKKPLDRKRRIKLLPCAIELIIKSHHQPITKMNPNRKREKLYRFLGKTHQDQKFAVQIKENQKGNKYFMSVFPLK